MKADPAYYDAQIAGWWVWGQCLWIGSGWCQRPEWTGRGVGAAANRGVHNKRMSGTGNGQGVGVHRVGIVPHAKRPKLRERGNDGVRHQFDRNAHGTAHQKRRPHLTNNQGGASSNRRWQGGGQGGGSGVHAPRLSQQAPAHNNGYGNGALSVAVERSGGLYEYLNALSVRLRRVRVCCGDWKRVLTPSVTTYVGLCGVLLDPPYSHEMRERCYSEDHDIGSDVRTWAIEHGDDPEFRIALCGYEGEHEMPDTWECVPWKAHGGYARTERGKENRERERIWFSPHCLEAELPLFAEAR